MTFTKTIIVTSIITVFSLIQAPMALGQSNDNAGSVLFVIGKGEIVDSDYNTRPLTRGAILKPGDEVSTQRGSRAQLKMSDGSFFSLRPNTQFQIKEFEFKEKASDKSFFGLLKGGFRAITGLIGRANKDAYSVTTPVATMGIRGTHYTALLCQQGDCSDEGSGMNDGLYVGVAEGGISLLNETGIINIDPQQFGFVQGSLTVPTLLPAPPAGLLNESSGSSNPAARSTGESDNAQKSGSDKPAAKDNKQVASNDSNSGNQGNKKVEAKSNAGGVLNLVENAANASITDTSIGSNAPLSYVDDTQSHANNNAVLTLQTNSGGISELTTFSDSTDNFAATVKIDTGYDSTTGLSWGRWNTGTKNTTTNIDHLHWAVGPNVTMPITGVSNYKLVGGTAPTNASGDVGVLGDASLTADFVNNQITNTAISIGLGNNIWKATDSTPRAITDSTFNGLLTGTITNLTNSANATITSGNYSGSFTGINASGAALSYSMSGTPNAGTATTLNGSVGLAK